MEAAARYNRFECSLCLEAFKDPRILPCFHTFCLICLKDYLSSIPKDNGTSSQFNCPLCRKVNSLPQDGVQGLQKNFYLDESDEKIKGKVQSCPDHPEEDLRFFCHNCNDSLCRDCKVIKHEGHKVEMLKNVVENMKKEIEKTLDDTEAAIDDSEVILVSKLETDIESLETALRVIKETSEQMNKDIDETFSMVNSLISPRLDIWNVKTEIVQTQSRGRHLTLMDLKDSFAEAIDKNDNELLFKLFKDLVQDGGEIRRLSARESLLPFSSKSSDADKMYIDIDLRKLSAFFFDFRDAVQKGLADFKKIFETCKISTDNEDVEMALEKIDGDSKVNIHEVKRKFEGPSQKRSKRFKGQLKFFAPGHVNPNINWDHNWKSGTVTFTWEENWICLEAESNDPRKPDFLAKLVPDSMMTVLSSCSVLNVKLTIPHTTWFQFRPDQPSDSQDLKLLAEELRQFKDKSTNVASSVSVARAEENKKTPKISQSDNIMLANVLATPSQNKRYFYRAWRNAENTVLSAGKKPCLSSERRPIQDMRQGQNLGFSATPQLTVTINPAYPGPRQTHPRVFTSPGNATSRGMPISHGSSSTSQVSATSNSTAAGGLGYQIITTQSPAINRITNPPQGSSFQGDPLNISMHVTAPSTNKQEIVKRNLELLVHASECKLENCHPDCRKFKRLIEHFNMCPGQKLVNPDCKCCKFLLGYCHIHAQMCKNANCKMINCLQIKEKHREP